MKHLYNVLLSQNILFLGKNIVSWEATKAVPIFANLEVQTLSAPIR